MGYSKPIPTSRIAIEPSLCMQVGCPHGWLDSPELDLHAGVDLIDFNDSVWMLFGLCGQPEQQTLLLTDSTVKTAACSASGLAASKR